MVPFSRSGSCLFHLEIGGSPSGMREVWEQAHRTGGFSGCASRPPQTVAVVVSEFVGLYGVRRADLPWEQFL